MNLETKRWLIDKEDKELSITEQCKVLGLYKSSLYYKRAPKYSEEDLKILNRMDEIFTEYPYYGYKRLHNQLLREGFDIGKDRVLKYMHVLGLEALYPKKKRGLSAPNKEHKIYPYLLKDIEIKRPNHVWAIDITYIRMKGGFVYLVAVIDWYSRYLLSHRISNSLESNFCKEALYEALSLYEKPEIFNSDQGSQFTSNEFTKTLIDNGIRISMDSKGRALDNIIIERFFRTIKYENIYISEYKIVKEVKEGVRKYIKQYNCKRLHQSLEYNTPYEIYSGIKELPID